MSHMYLNNNFSVLHPELCRISVLSITVMFSSVVFCMIIYRCSSHYHSILLLRTRFQTFPYARQTLTESDTQKSGKLIRVSQTAGLY